MGQVRHGSATTTHAIRAAIQRSHASLATLSRELGINPKTVAKWRKRATVEDLKTGPKEPCSTTMSAEEEAMVVASKSDTRQKRRLGYGPAGYAYTGAGPSDNKFELEALTCHSRLGVSKFMALVNPFTE